MILVYVLLVVIAVVLTVIATATLVWMMHAWTNPAAFVSTGYAQAEEPTLSFSLIMPCRDESEAVMDATLQRLLAQDHPDFEIVISLGHDDEATIAIAQRLAAAHRQVRLSINHDRVKNKPRQLNTALAECTKDVVGIIDAESLTQPGLLRHIDGTFAASGADAVQGSVHLMNFQSSWFSLRNCLEYRIWFRSRLHSHARSGFIPLGGNTVFIKRQLLEAVDGWDGDCLAEDCEIGVRLSALGKRIVCAYDGGLTTQEEAPESIGALIKQRTRWGLGFMQVLAKGEWKRLPTRTERFSAWWVLVQQHAVAFAGLVLPIAILAALFLNPPELVVLLTFMPAVPTLAMLVFDLLILREFGQDMGLRVRFRDYVKLVVSMPFYQVLLAVATTRALWKYTVGDFAWEKTAHSGAHHAQASPASVATGLRLAGEPAARERVHEGSAA